MKRTHVKLFTFAILLSLTTGYVQAMKGEPAKENNPQLKTSTISGSKPNGKPLPPPPGVRSFMQQSGLEAPKIKESAPSPTTVAFDASTPPAENVHQGSQGNSNKNDSKNAVEAAPQLSTIETGNLKLEEPTAAQKVKQESVETRQSLSQKLSNTVNNAASKFGSKVGLTKGTIKRTTTDPKTGITTVETTAPSKPDVVLSSKTLHPSTRDYLDNDRIVTTNFKVDSNGDYIKGADGKPLIQSKIDIITHEDHNLDTWKTATTTIYDDNGQPQTITKKNMYGRTITHQEFYSNGGYTLTTPTKIIKLEISYDKNSNNRIETTSKFDTDHKLIETTSIETDAKTGDKTSIKKDENGKLIQTIRETKNEKGQLVSKLDYPDGSKAEITLDSDFTLKIQDTNKNGVPQPEIIINFQSYIKDVNDFNKTNDRSKEDQRGEIAHTINAKTYAKIGSTHTRNVFWDTETYQAVKKNIMNAIEKNSTKAKVDSQSSVTSNLPESTPAPTEKAPQDITKPNAIDNNLQSNDSTTSDKKSNGNPPPPPGFKPLPPRQGVRGMHSPETKPAETSTVKESAPTTVTSDASTPLAENVQQSSQGNSNKNDSKNAVEVPQPSTIDAGDLNLEKLTPAQKIKQESVETRRSYSQALSNKINNAASKIGSVLHLTDGTTKRTTTETVINPNSKYKAKLITTTTLDKNGNVILVEYETRTPTGGSFGEYISSEKTISFHSNGKIKSEITQNMTTNYDDNGKITSTYEHSRSRDAAITINYKDGKPHNGTFQSIGIYESTDPYSRAYTAKIEFTDTNGSYKITDSNNKILEVCTITNGKAKISSYNEKSEYQPSKIRTAETDFPSLGEIGRYIAIRRDSEYSGLPQAS